MLDDFDRQIRSFFLTIPRGQEGARSRMAIFGLRMFLIISRRRHQNLVPAGRRSILAFGRHGVDALLVDHAYRLEGRWFPFDRSGLNSTIVVSATQGWSLKVILPLTGKVLPTPDESPHPNIKNVRSGNIASFRRIEIPKCSSMVTLPDLRWA